MHQESPNIKQMKLRIPMQLFYQIEKDAKAHGTTTSEWARFQLAKAEAGIKLDSADFVAIAKLVAEAERKLNNPSPTRKPRNLTTNA